MPTFNTTDPKPGYVYDAAIDTWFPLLGIAPASQVDRWTKTAAGGETSLSGNDDNAESLSYTAGTEQVYLNGVLLVRGQDYTASNGTTITGLSALAASDIAEVVTFNPSNIITTDAVLSTDFDAKGDLISASAASTPIRVPVGTNGYVLKANSATTSGLEWGALDDADAIQSSIVDAKGDIIAATADNTVARLAVGTNGQVLTADSTAATGLAYTTISAGGMTLLSTTTLSGASTTISVSSTGYNRLMIDVTGVTNDTADGELFIKPNNQNSLGYATGVKNLVNTKTLYNFRGDSIYLSGGSNLDSANADNRWTIFIDYPAAVYHPIIVYGRASVGSNNFEINAMGATLNNAITSLVFVQSGGSFLTGTVRVFGVK